MEYMNRFFNSLLVMNKPADAQAMPGNSLHDLLVISSHQDEFLSILNLIRV